jgi:hypothetical protein
MKQSHPEIHKERLCNAVAASLTNEDVLAYQLDGPYHNSVVVRANMGRADMMGMLSAGAATDNEGAMMLFIDQVWSESTSSEICGTPLLAAAVNGQVRATSSL